MALTQSARIPGPGPSWDEEVVPVLRKRLESESRTLARRISAISVSSNEDLTSDAAYIPSAYSNPRTGTRPDPAPRISPERSINSSRINGAASTSSQRPPSARSRTYSQPYQVDSHSTKGKQVNGSINGTTRSPDNLSTNSSIRPISPRPSVSETPKPSRIPQPTRSRAMSITGHPQFSPQNVVDSLPYGSPHTPHTHTQQDPSRSADLWIVHEAPLNSTSSASSSITSAQRGGPGLLQEPAPFKPGSTSSSAENLDPPRPSIDSEERPFEHWYRGEVSRNGGVGELRVAKRQEMLEIANFGHDLENTKKARNAITDAIEERRRRRKRADSLGQIGERASFYMDEEKAREIARVMDENPPTDLEDGDQMDYDEDEDVDDEDNQSEYYDPPDRSRSSFDHYNPSTTATTTPTASSSSRYDPRSTTPTPATVGGRSSSRNQHHPRTTTPTQRGRSEQPSLPGASASTPTLLSTPPNNHNSASSKARPGQQQSRTKSHGTPSSSIMGSPLPSTPQGAKRGASPGTPASGSGSASKKSRMAASKATQAKLAEKKRKEELEKKKSVAYYPDPGEDEDMADVIPTWTQPVPKQGNWDDVVLPVVARKKGLDGHFEQADGSPRPKHSSDTVAPAPGTFGYDHSKYRPPREDLGEGIPMDEFGRPMPMRQRQEGQGDDMDMDNPSSNPYASSNPHDEIRLPASMSKSASGSRSQQHQHQQSSSSPAPFSDYAPGVRTAPRQTDGMRLNENPSRNGTAEVDLERLAEQQEQKKEQEAEEETSGGCCKCVVM